MNSLPTLKDVAKLAGVSEMTASRVLRNKADVSKATRLKVEEAATSIGYVPNRIAGALASKTVNLVGIVVPSLSSFVFPEVLSGISNALESSPLQPVIGLTGYDLQEEEKVIREMLSWRPSGLIVAGLEHSDRASKLLKGADIPVVEVMDVDGAAAKFCVGISHLKAGRMMAAAMVAKGYKHISFVGTKMPQDFRATKRLEGFTNYLAEHGLQLADRELYDGASSIAKGREITERILARTPKTDCMYYSSDVMSVGGLMHCLCNKIDVPGRVALAGFNDLELLNGLPKNLATTNSFRFQIGLNAGEIVRDPDWRTRLEKQQRTVFEPEIKTGDTL